MDQTLRAQMHHAMGGGEQDCQRNSNRDGSTEHNIVKALRSARLLLLAMPAQQPRLGLLVGLRWCSEEALRRHVTSWHG